MLRPEIIRTCRVMPAAVTKARQNSSASCGSNGGRAERVRLPAGPEVHLVDEVGTAGQVEGDLDRAPRRAASRWTRSGGRRPCRRAPPASASPSRMPTSSTVWWASTSRSPVGRARQVEAGVPAELGEHVVEEGQARRDRHRGPSPSTRQVDLDRGLLGDAGSGVTALAALVTPAPPPGRRGTRRSPRRCRR